MDSGWAESLRSFGTQAPVGIEWLEFSCFGPLGDFVCLLRVSLCVCRVFVRDKDRGFGVYLNSQVVIPHSMRNPVCWRFWIPARSASLRAGLARE